MLIKQGMNQKDFIPAFYRFTNLKWLRRFVRTQS